MTEAKTQAETMVSEAKAQVNREQTAARRELAELTRQRDTITGHLTQLRSLLGSMAVPGVESPPAVGSKKDDDVVDAEVVEEDSSDNDKSS